MNENPNSGAPEVCAEKLRAATHWLEAISADRALLRQLPEAERTRLLQAAGRVARPDSVDRRRLRHALQSQRKAERIAREERVLTQTGIRTHRRKPVFTTPNVYPPADFVPEPVRIGTPESAAPAADDLLSGSRPGRRGEAGERNCYICKRDYVVIHEFYDQLCPACAALNFRKRTELADLRGRVALLTGGRVKIGYQAGIKLLRCGARLIVSTRFPRDAAKRYAAEPDFPDWSSRLEIFGLDLRHTPSVEAFCAHVSANYERLDFIVNNACQTVRRPPEYYGHMLAAETGPLREFPAAVARLVGAYEGLRGYHLLPETLTRTCEDVTARNGTLSGLTHAATLSQLPILPEDARRRDDLFPAGRLDQDLQQVDLRERNSWRLLLAEVSSVELLEVQLINAIAPFVLNARLKPLLLRTPERDKHIVNVSAVEGQFYRKFKTTRHPHTNMAKAALNMMTRTSATDYHADGIHMNSVDTGWVTDEDPAVTAARKMQAHRFHPPLDIVDGAARIVDPIIAGFNTGEHIWGKFLKDYRVTDW